MNSTKSDKSHQNETMPKIHLDRPRLDEINEIDSLENSEEEEEDLSLPSFKSVIFRNQNLKKLNNAEENLFFDSEKCQWVKVDNFSFAQNSNHFEENSETSSLALLDSKILEETTEFDDSKIILDQLQKNLQDFSEGDSFTTTSSSQPNTSLNVSLDSQNQINSSSSNPRPKIRQTSPRSSIDKCPKNLRKLSKNESQNVLPSRTSPNTTTTTTTTSETGSKYARNSVRGSKKSSPIEKKLSLEKTAKKLGRNLSHSATNLNKLSVKDYHESFQLRRMSST
jgi:hypothetical protein